MDLTGMFLDEQILFYILRGGHLFQCLISGLPFCLSQVGEPAVLPDLAQPYRQPAFSLKGGAVFNGTTEGLLGQLFRQRLVSTESCQIGSGFMLAREIGQYKESADTYAGLSEYVTPAETDGENGDAEAPEGTGASSVSLPKVDFESLLAQGPDVKAWLELPGTVIQYPVAQGEDNSYYLKHLYDGTANKVGCLFIDYENAEDFSDNNTIIYGHNMRDGSMFSTLVEYKAQAYYDEHPEMYLVTPEGGYVVEVFSAFVASPEESGSETSPWALEWKDSGAYTTWLSAMQERSVIETGVSVTSSDKVLTLSTCTNGGADRFIVMGRLVAVTE